MNALSEAPLQKSSKSVRNKNIPTSGHRGKLHKIFTKTCKIAERIREKNC